MVNEYPIYEQRSVFQLVLAASPQEARAPPSEISGRMHAFISADKVWTIVIGGDGLILSTRRYERWEDFKQRLRLALEAFLAIYRLPILTRIGLRYQDVISRESLGLDGKQWRELLQPHIAGEFLDGALSDDDVLARQTLLTIKLRDKDMLLLRHGLVTHRDNHTLAYLIDSDFYNEEQRTADPNGTLDVAERTPRQFRSAIQVVHHRGTSHRNGPRANSEFVRIMKLSLSATLPLRPNGQWLLTWGYCEKAGCRCPRSLLYSFAGRLGRQPKNTNGRARYL